MKKLLIIGAIIAITAPFLGFAAVKVLFAEQVSWSEAIFQFRTAGSGDILINRLVDGETTCYLATHEHNGNFQFSCVK